MPSMKEAASRSYDDKLGRMGLKIRTAEMGDKAEGHAYAQTDGTQGKVPVGYADDYRVGDKAASMVEGKKPKPRIDRPGYANGGSVKGKGTTVNVIVAPGGNKPPMPMPVPMPAAGPAPMPPMPAPMAGGAPAMGGAPMPLPRKKGGRVPYTGGALGARGRLEKVQNYGDNAYPNGKK